MRKEFTCKTANGHALYSLHQYPATQDPELLSNDAVIALSHRRSAVWSSNLHTNHTACGLGNLVMLQMKINKDVCSMQV